MDYPQPKQSRILVIGETCIDRYFLGTCERLSPEAPVPVLKVDNEKTKKGMASNVASNIVSLGQNCHVLTNKSSIVKTRFIDTRSKQHILRVDLSDTCEPLEVEEFQNIFLGEYDATIISDYNKGFLPENVLEKIIHLLPKPVFVDTKKKDLSFYENCVIKLNESESKQVHNMPNNSNLVVTLGDRGAKFKDVTFSTNKCEVIDVCGAGDAFLASLVVHFCQFKDGSGAIKFANICARVTVQKIGVHSVSIDELS